MIHKELIIDTGFFVALFFKNDQFHKKALQLRKTINHRKWITTWPVLTEVGHLLMARGASLEIVRLLQIYEAGGFDIFCLSMNHISQITKALEKYNKLPMDLADASLVILAEELGHGDIVSTDARDFEIYKWKNHKPFNNLFYNQLLQ